MRKILIKTLKIAGSILLILLVLLVLLCLISQTGWFKNQIRLAVEKQANNNLNAELRVGKLQGNLWSNLRLENIKLTQNEQELLTIESIELDYDLKRILKKQIRFNAIKIQKPEMHFIQQEDGSWNFQEIMAAKTKKDTSATPFNWSIEIAEFSQNDGKITLQFSEHQKFLPQEILIPQIQASAKISNEISWQIDQAALNILPQEFRIELSEVSSKNPDMIDISRLQLESAKSRILARGRINSLKNRSAEITLLANPLSLAELNKWLPSPRLAGNPEINIAAQLNSNQLQVKLAMSSGKQNLDLALNLADYQNPFQAEIAGSWQNFDIHSWLPDQKQSNLNGNISFISSGNNLEEIEIATQLKLAESSWNGRKVQAVDLKCQGNRQKFREEFTVDSEWGRLNLAGNIEDILENIGYDLKGNVQELNVQPFVKTLHKPTNLNADFSIIGAGKTLETIEANLQLSIKKTEIENIQIDSFFLDTNLDAGNYLLHSLYFMNPYGNLHLSGSGALKGKHNLVYSVWLDSLPKLPVPQLADLKLKGSISGSVNGDLEEFTNHSSLKIIDLKYQQNAISELNGEIDLIVKDKQPTANIEAEMIGITAGGMNFDSLYVQSKYEPETVIAEIRLHKSASQELHTRLQFWAGALNRLLISQLDLFIAGENWENSNDSLQIEFYDEHYDIRNLNLKNGEQAVIADGYIDLQGDNEFSISFQNGDINSLLSIAVQDIKLSGNLNFSATLSGTRETPKLISQLEIRNGEYEGYSFSGLVGNFILQDRQINVDFHMNRSEQEYFTLNGFIPIDIDLAANTFQLNRERQLSLQLRASPIDLELLKLLNKNIKQSQGEILLQANLENTLENPLLDASIKLENGKVKIPDYGIDYKKIKLDIETSRNEITLNNFSVQTGAKKNKGKLKINGTAFYDFQENRIDTLLVSILAKKWTALNNKDLALNIDSDLKISGNGQNPIINGSIKINRSRYYMASNKNQSIVNKPMLVKAQMIQVENSSDMQKQKTQIPLILKNMRGDIMLSFPRNTWIRSRDMYIELGGEIRVVKKDQDFTLFGTVQIIRGTYKFYGKKFDIIDGSVVLNGEEDYNPQINLEARYRMRSSSGINNLLGLIFRGTLKNPTIHFTYNGTEISEADGFAYLIFGKSLNELSYSEKKQIDQTASNNIATKLITEQVISQVTNSIRNELDLDVIEFKESNNWQQASLMVGKYLTNDLFISYQKEFSFGRSRGVIPEQVSLEYEIRKYLSIQAVSGGGKTTGFNLVWKFQK
ncbi:MAG: translocation/assembly module TamB domain-containing protein [Candidatus Cloacimonadales bacterium]|nr:translocation/assembly module TamB domain-containing protein [Candidatus Cloacimonadales bacterium]